MQFTIYDCITPPGRVTLQEQIPFLMPVFGLEPMENDDREFYALHEGGPAIDFTTVSESRAAALARRLSGKTSLLVLDIEEYWTVPPQSGAEELKTELVVGGEETEVADGIQDMNDRLLPAAQYVRSAGWTGLLGLYSVIPTYTAGITAQGGTVNLYDIARFAPYYDSFLPAWRARNTALVNAGFLTNYNIFCPSIYPSYAPGGGWTAADELSTTKRRATMLINECRRLSPATPVIFYVRGLHGTSAIHYFDPSFLEATIRHCKEIGADGVAVWEGYSSWTTYRNSGILEMLSILSRELCQPNAGKYRNRSRRRSRTQGDTYGL